METPTTISQAQILADVFDETRKLTNFYLKKIDPSWAEWQPIADGVKLNNAYWLVAHLAWAEHGMLVESLGGPKMDIDWLTHYKLGSDGSLHSPRPTFEELLQDFHQVHQHAMAFVRTLTEEQLDTPAVSGTIPWNTSKRKVFYHAIRHEGTHVGHLGWLCKIKGVVTI